MRGLRALVMLALVAEAPQSWAASLKCPANFFASSGVGCSGVVNFPAPTGGAGAVTCLPPSGSSFPVGTTSISCQALNPDLFPLFIRCGFSVTVSDTQRPSIVCEPDRELQADLATECGAVLEYQVTATDTCPGVTTVQTAGLPPGAIFPLGTAVNVFKAIDAGGNTAECTFRVRVVDADGPRLRCPATINVPQPGPVEYQVLAEDCSAVDLSLSPPSGSTFPVGTTVVSATARDSEGNDAFCAFAVVVEKPSDPPPTGCEVAPTFASVNCRLDALGPVVTAATTGPVGGRLNRVLDRARALVHKAESLQAAGRTRPARAALRKSIARMGRFRRTVLARKSGLDDAARTALQGQADAVAADLQTLRGS